MTGEAAQPMPARISAWAVYDVFETARHSEQVFVGVVSDSQWVAFCKAFGLEAFGSDPAYAENNLRVRAREVLLPPIRAIFGAMTREELTLKLEQIGLPFAPINRPEDLFNDPHLQAGGLLEVTIPGGDGTKLPALPIEIDGARMKLRYDIPLQGADMDSILREIGYGEGEGVLAAGLTVGGDIEAPPAAVVRSGGTRLDDSQW